GRASNWSSRRRRRCRASRETTTWTCPDARPPEARRQARGVPGEPWKEGRHGPGATAEAFPLLRQKRPPAHRRKDPLPPTPAPNSERLLVHVPPRPGQRLRTTSGLAAHDLVDRHVVVLERIRAAREIDAPDAEFLVVDELFRLVPLRL